MATQNDKKIKVKFYILTFIGFTMLIGSFLMGFLLDIYGKYFSEVPKYKLFIFYGCGILCCLYGYYYIKYAFKHDSALTKKKKKKE
jgi:MFS family permease